MPHIMNVIMPRGIIIKWSGTIASIPSGFTLCDGSTVNGTTTPDLRAKFSRGVNTNATNPGSTGGEDSHVLTTSELPSHNHGITETSHSHSFPGWDTVNQSNGSGAHTGTGNGTSYDALAGVSIGNTGGGLGHENRPAYYECLYIMKVVDT